MIYAVNFWAVLVATVAVFLLGWLWHSKLLFGKIWMKIAKPNKNKSPIISMLLGFLTVLITGYFVGIIVSSTGSATAVGGLIVGVVLFAGFALMKHLGALIWMDTHPTLFWIETFHDLLSFLIMGVILGAML